VPDTQLGQALLDVPMDQIIQRMGVAISRAQHALDEMSIQSAVELGMTTLDLREAGGAVVSRSLFELGFLPTFYQFTETTIEVSVSLSIRTGDDQHIGGSVSFGGASTVPAGGGTGATGASVRALTGPGPAGQLPSTTPGGIAAGAGQLLGGLPVGTTGLMYGITLNADYTRRYEFDSSAASKVTTKMVAVPAPPAFLQALRTNFGIGTGP